MKLKIYVVKKQKIIWAAVILAIIIISAILIITIKTTQTFNFLNLSNSYKADINNDGKIDSVIAKVNSKTQEYTINVICSDENGYNLEPDPVIKSFGYNTSKSPINITFNDINNDGSQEIFLQSSDTSGPILHVFKYTQNKIERIASGRYSMYGLIKDPSDDSQVLVLCSKNNSDIHLTYLKATSDKLTPYVAQESLTLGTNALSTVINYIEQKDISAFNLNIDSKIESKLTEGTLIDGIIKSTKYSLYDIPSECTYILRTDSSNNGESQVINYKIILSLSKYDPINPKYNILSIDKVK